MVVEGNADESSPDTQRPEAHDDRPGIANEGGTQEWDHLFSEFGLGKAPRSPPAIRSFEAHHVTRDAEHNRRQVGIETPVGVNNVFVVYRGPFRTLRLHLWGLTAHLHRRSHVAGKQAFTDIPITGNVGDGAIALSGVQLLVTSDDMTTDE